MNRAVPHKRSIAIAALIAVATGTAGVVVYRRALPWRETPAIRDAKLAVASDVAGANYAKLIREKTAEIAASKFAQAGITDGRSADQLAKATSEAVKLYHAGCADDYINWLKGQGLSVPPLYQSASSAEEQWRRGTQNVAGTVLRPSELRIQMRVRAGQPVFGAPDQSSGVQISASRKDRGPNDVDPEAAATDAVEVFVPGTFRTNDGTPFAGEFALELARRPADGAWLRSSS